MQAYASQNTHSQELATRGEEIFNILHDRIAEFLAVGFDKVFVPIQVDQLEVLASILAYPVALLIELLRNTKIIQKNNQIRVDKLGSSLRFHTTIFINDHVRWVRFDGVNTDSAVPIATPGGKRSGRSSPGSSPDTPHGMKRARSSDLATPSPQAAVPSSPVSPHLMNPAHKY
jgi:hypothetical protein